MDGICEGLSDYFNSPGTAAIRECDSPSGSRLVDYFCNGTGGSCDVGFFFDDMGERARGLMIRNKFIAAQPSRALRQHLDGASAEASIRDIVDSCRVWESQAEDGYDGPDEEFPHIIASVKEEGRPALGPVASDMLREIKGWLLQLPALPAAEAIWGSPDGKLLRQWIMGTAQPEMGAPTLVPGLDGGIDSSPPVPLEPVLEKVPPVRGGIGCVSHAVTRDMGWADAQG